MPKGTKGTSAVYPQHRKQSMRPSKRVRAMNDAPTGVLLIEDDPVDTGLIQAALQGVEVGSFRVEWVSRVSDALERLGGEGIDVVLFDLTLPDGQGLDAFDRVFEAANSGALVLVLCATGDEDTARRAVQRGAQDYFVKGQADTHWLPRALRYLIDRKATQDALRNSKARFRAMSDASPLGIFVSDAHGGCVYTNAAYHLISGLTFENALGTNWSMAIHPEDRPRPGAKPGGGALSARRWEYRVDTCQRCPPARRDGTARPGEYGRGHHRA